MEMAAPFLFLSPDTRIRRMAFAVNVLLMAGIALFGNFGPLQALLVAVGFCLLEDENEAREEVGGEEVAAVRGSALKQACEVLALALALAATVWTLHDVSAATCEATWQAPPLVYGLLALALLTIATDKASGRMGVGEAATATVLLGGSAIPLAGGLDAPLPFESLLNALNVGASPYGLFAIITGVGGRPVTLIEAASSLDGPWLPVPLRYQVRPKTADLPGVSLAPALHLPCISL